MRRYWEIDQTFAQPSESLLKKNLKESVKKQKGKGNKLEPVVISGRTIAKSWWGKAWCDNLERYADFASRLERGKRYVRTIWQRIWRPFFMLRAMCCTEEHRWRSGRKLWMPFREKPMYRLLCCR